MSINLTKGQKINLSKEYSGLRGVVVGLGWDPVKKGLFSKAYDVDCDASAILLDENGGCVHCVYYGARSYSNQSVVHHGDNLTGEGSGDDEQISVNLNSLPSKVHRIVFTVNIYNAFARRQDFGMIKNAYIRLVNEESGNELCRYNLSDGYDGKTAMIMAEVFRKGNEWGFEAVGKGTNHNSIQDIIAEYR